MIVSDVMAHEVVSVRAADDVRTAAALLVSRGLSAAPVVDDRCRLVGSVAEADLLRAGASGTRGRPQHGRWTVSEVMAGPVAVAPGDDLDLVVSLLGDVSVRCVAVVEDGELAGVVTRREVLALLAGHDPLARREVLALLAEVFGAAPQAYWRVEVADGVAHLGLVQGAHVSRTDRDLAVVLARTVPGVVGVVVEPAVGGAPPARAS